MIKAEDCLRIGRVVKTHNLKGEVVITSENDLLETYQSKPVFLLLEGRPVPFFIATDGLTVKNNSSYIVKFDFVDNLQQAQHLVGCEVLLEKELLQEESDVSDYSLDDLLGYLVMDEYSSQEGKVTDVADYSGNVVLTIEIFGKKILLPVSEVYISEIDVEHKKLSVKIPQEIINLY